jgi:hypothetical protein
MDPRSWCHAHRISRELGDLDPVLSWCRNNNQDDWAWQAVDWPTDRRPGVYIFFFQNSKDALAFVLKYNHEHTSNT